MSRYDVVIVCERDDPAVLNIFKWLHGRGQTLVDVDQYAGDMFSRKVYAGTVELDSPDALFLIGALTAVDAIMKGQRCAHPLRDNGTKGGQ